VADQEFRLKTIVVGVDGSDQSGRALKWAIGLAREVKAEVIAVYALSMPTYAYIGPDFVLPAEYDAGVRAEMQRAFEKEWCGSLDRSGVRHRKLFLEGRAPSVLTKVAEQEKGDLLVVGRRGRGAVTEQLLGSVSYELSHRSRIPVVLIEPLPSHG
jgi:nucleotide-binding universal stress UspA family protein